MAPDFDPVSHELGALRVLIETHIKSVDRDRKQLDADRQTSATYRKEVRAELKSLSDGVKEIGPMKKRLDRIEPIVEDHGKKLFVASMIIGGALAIIGLGLKTWGADIKALVMRILRIS